MTIPQRIHLELLYPGGIGEVKLYPVFRDCPEILQDMALKGTGVVRIPHENDAPMEHNP